MVLGKAKMELMSLAIDRVRPQPDKLGHEVRVKAKVKVTKRKAGALSGEGIDSLEPEWKETIDWFERGAGGEWRHKELEPVKDMYKTLPDSKTFRDWNKNRYYFAIERSLGNVPPKELTDAIQKFNGAEERDKAAKHWIADNGHEWFLHITDEPALGTNPGPSSGGGGGPSKVTSNSRRRVVYFDLGFKGSNQRVTATQILETVNGTATIRKFIFPGISKAQADDPSNLAAWRNELTLNPTT